MTTTSDPPRLWAAADLAAFLGLKPRTVTTLARRRPERLPPRVQGLQKLRWVPSVCAAWAERQSSTPPRKGGRPRAA
jgi:hypothetical protein